MKIDGRKRKRIKPPYCNGEHVFGDFTISSKSTLIKVCKLCPAIQTKEEFLKLGGRGVKKKRIAALKISHLDLFHF